MQHASIAACSYRALCNAIMSHLAITCPEFSKNRISFFSQYMYCNLTHVQFFKHCQSVACSRYEVKGNTKNIRLKSEKLTIVYRSGAKLLSLGGTHGDLSVLLAGLKEIKNTTKSLIDSQSVGKSQNFICCFITSMFCMFLSSNLSNN